MRNDIIIKITGQQLIELGYYIGEYNLEDKFNLHIDISDEQIRLAPDVDGANIDHSWEFDYQETMANLNLSGYFSNGICAGVDYSYNDILSEKSRVCNFDEIASICGLSHDELSAFECIDSLNDFILRHFYFSNVPQYICEKEVLEYIGEVDVYIDMHAKKINCFNSRKGTYETISFGEACLEDTIEEDDLKEYFEDCYPDNVVNIIFL